MVTRVGTETDLNKMLTHLIELDFDAIEAYDAAIDRLEDKETRARLKEFRDDHQQHTKDLSPFLVNAGKKAPDKGGPKRLLTKGKVIIANLRGDKAILQAMKSNEDDTNTAYERAVEHKDCPAAVKDVLKHNLADERRHRDWIVNRIAQMG